MDIDGRRFLVAGVSGALGGKLAGALLDGGAEVAGTANSSAPDGELAGRLAGDPIDLDLADADSCRAAVGAAADQLGGLDGLLIATGTVAFGKAGELSAGTARRLAEVNASGPIELIEAAVPEIEEGGAIVAITAVVAEFPTAGMAAYSASKAALSGYLTALRREQRRRLATVLEVRPGHMETGFAERALEGEPPKLPEPEDADELIARILTALDDETSVLRYDPRERELVAE